MDTADHGKMAPLPATLEVARTAVVAAAQALARNDLDALEALADHTDLLIARSAALPDDAAFPLIGPDGLAAALLELAATNGRTRLLLHRRQLVANEELSYVLRLLGASPGYAGASALPPSLAAGRQLDRRA